MQQVLERSQSANGDYSIDDDSGKVNTKDNFAERCGHLAEKKCKQSKSVICSPESASRVEEANSRRSSVILAVTDPAANGFTPSAVSETTPTATTTNGHYSQNDHLNSKPCSETMSSSSTSSGTSRSPEMVSKFVTASCNGNTNHWTSSGINTAKMFASRWAAAQAAAAAAEAAAAFTSDHSASSSPPTSSSSSFSGLFGNKQADCDSVIQKEEGERVDKTWNLFSRQLSKWESRLAEETCENVTNALSRAYVLRINRLSCLNPLALRSLTVDSSCIANFGSSRLEQSESSTSGIRNDINSLEYLMTSDEEDSFMSNDGGDGSKSDPANPNTSGNSCFKYRLKRPRLQCIEEEIANLNLNIDQPDSSSSATAVDFPDKTAPALISSRPFNEFNLNKSSTLNETSFKEIKNEGVDFKKKEFLTSSLVDPFDLLPRKAEEKAEEPKCRVETTSIRALISAIKRSLVEGLKNKIGDNKKSEPIKMCLPLLKIVSLEASSLKSLPNSASDEIHELALNRLTMDSSNSCSNNSSSPDELAKMMKEKNQIIQNQQKSCFQNGNNKRKDSLKVSFLDSDDELENISSHVVPDILSSLSTPTTSANGESQVNPFGTTGRLPIATATEMQEKFELQRAIMEDIEERTAKMKKSAVNTTVATYQEKVATDGSSLNNPYRTLSSFLRPSTSVLASTRKNLSTDSSSESTTNFRQKEHSSLTALLEQKEEEQKKINFKSATAERDKEAGGDEESQNSQTLSFLERARLRAARQPCSSLPPVSPFVGTLGGKNFEESDSSNSTSNSGPFSFLRSNNQTSNTSLPSSFIAGIIGKALEEENEGESCKKIVFGGAATFNPNSPLAPRPSQPSLSPAEMAARNSRIDRFFSKLAAEGESRADIQALAAASTLSLISSVGVGTLKGGVEKDGDNLEQNDKKTGDDKPESDKDANPIQPYKPFTRQVEASTAASFMGVESLPSSSSSTNHPQQPSHERCISGKAPMKRRFLQSHYTSLRSSPPASPAAATGPPLFYEDDEATMDMVLKMSAQEAALTKVFKSHSNKHSRNSKIPKTDGQLSVFEADKRDDIEVENEIQDEDEEHWRSIPSTSGTQKVKPGVNEPIPGYPKLVEQQQQPQPRYFNYNAIETSSSSSFTSSANYQSREVNLVGQKRKREVTFIEMIKEGGCGKKSPPPSRPLSSTSKGGDDHQREVMIEEDDDEILDDGIPRHSSKHQAIEPQSQRLSKLPLNPPVYSSDGIPLGYRRPVLGLSATSAEVDDILIDSDSDEIIVPLVPRNTYSNQQIQSHPDRKMAKARSKQGKILQQPSSSFHQLPVQKEVEVEKVDEEVITHSEFRRKSPHHGSAISTTLTAISSPWTTTSSGSHGGYSTYNIGATQQWDLNDRYWERFSATFVTSCAEEVPEAVAVDICEALQIWKQPKAFELQAKRRYTVLLRRGPLKSEETGGKKSSKGDHQSSKQEVGGARRAHERFRIVIGIDFYNSTTTERRHAIENWKFLEQEQAFSNEKRSSFDGREPRLFEVLPNANTHSVDFFEFDDEDQQHTFFWSPENTFRDHSSEIDYDPDCTSTSTSFDLKFHCLTEHFVNFMEIAENPMRLTIKIERLLNTTKLSMNSSSHFLSTETAKMTEMIASDRPQRFEYAKVAKLSCGVRILNSEEKKNETGEPSNTNPDK